MRLVALLSILLLMAACGAEPGGEQALQADGSVDPDVLVGVYALDVQRITGGRTTDADGNEIELSPEKLKEVQQGHDPESFRLELKADGTFEQITAMGEEDFRSGGTWRETTAGIEVATKTLNGEPAPKEMQLTELYQRESGYLVVEQGGLRVYLKKRAELP
ncbi:MAG: hypothetical protein QNJ90_05305 [Planctomycetota bacterium]|nr:hypothetical protein [Planctomycetota bacterium]